MSWSTRAKRKGLPKRLRAALREYELHPNFSKISVIFDYVHKLNHTFNNEHFHHSGRNLKQILCQKIYRDNTVALLIHSLPFFPQNLINEISTLLQTTIRQFPQCSLPSYLMNNIETFDMLFSFLSLMDQPNVSNITHILFRACAIQDEFMTFLFDHGVVGSFIQFLSADSFDRIGAAFSTYDCFLNFTIDVSSQYVTNHWDIFSTHFKLIMASPNYIVQLNFIPILLKFITAEECRPLFMNYLSDIDNLELVMRLLGPKCTKRVQFNAYALFKLFVLNPRKVDPIVTILRMNREPLVHFLENFSFDLEAEQELEAEKQQVLNLIRILPE